VNSPTDGIVRIGIDRLDLRVVEEGAIDAVEMEQGIRVALGGTPFDFCRRKPPRQGQDDEAREKDATK
jgi:hypothetical protein